MRSIAARRPVPYGTPGEWAGTGGESSATLLRVAPHDGETDPFDLQRFVTAQDSGGTYERAAAELRAGRKASHWMWFVFPQIPMARAYAITSLAEARAYLAHPVLGPRLAECAAILAGLSGRTAEQIFGEVDALKLRSSMTLFMHADPGQPVFGQVLEQYFDGIPDSATEQRI
jgi:uncharacterized protein (DUF1810 family)